MTSVTEKRWGKKTWGNRGEMVRWPWVSTETCLIPLRGRKPSLWNHSPTTETRRTSPTVGYGLVFRIVCLRFDPKLSWWSRPTRHVTCWTSWHVPSDKEVVEDRDMIVYTLRFTSSYLWLFVPFFVEWRIPYGITHVWNIKTHLPSMFRRVYILKEDDSLISTSIFT